MLAVLVIIVVIVLSLIKNKPGPKYLKTNPELNIPGYDLIYSDQKGDFGPKVVVSKILFSPKYHLRGKPDFVFARKSSAVFGEKISLVPVEVKSASAKKLDAPRRGDLMQLGAYFLLIEEVYGAEPIEGRILYRDALFIVKNVREVKKEVLAVIEEMKNIGNVPPDVRADFVKCKNCVCRGTVCDLA
jgi:CRISPR-associated exonuclease Cas4